MTATATTVDTTPDAASLRTSSRRLVVGMATLVLVDLVGGLVAVATDVNTWSQAWGTYALLAAPLPMILGQVLMTVLSTRTSRPWGSLPALVLALASLVSIVSGFFDGGLGHESLTAWHAAYQVLLLVVTGVVALLAAARARVLLTQHGR